MAYAITKDQFVDEWVVAFQRGETYLKDCVTKEEMLSGLTAKFALQGAAGRMVDYAKARREYGAARYQQIRVTNRLEALKLVDSEGRLTPELEAEMRKLATEAKEIEERIAKTTAKSDKLKKTLPKQKQDIPDFVSHDR